MTIKETVETQCRRMTDMELLSAVLAEPDLTETEMAAFVDMTDHLQRVQWAALTQRQREWVERVADRCGVARDTNLVSRGLVPRGREVPTPPILRRENLPMKPPGRGNR